MPKPPPKLPPPPSEAVRLWLAWQAAIEHTAEMRRQFPSTEESVTGGIAMPLLDAHVVEALNAEVEAAFQFHSCEWWFGSQAEPRLSG